MHQGETRRSVLITLWVSWRLDLDMVCAKVKHHGYCYFISTW
jgi:hypothetical protein